MRSRHYIAAVLLLAIALPGIALAETKSATFSPPLIRKVSPDSCLTAGANCGKPAADAFCKAAGYQESRKHVVLSGTAPAGVTQRTIYLGDGQSCGRGCKPLVLVACFTAAPNFTATSSSDFGTVVGD